MGLRKLRGGWLNLLIGRLMLCLGLGAWGVKTIEGSDEEEELD